MNEIPLSQSPKVHAAVCYLGMRDDVLQEMAVLNFGRCLVESATGRRVAVEEQVAVRISDTHVVVAVQQEGAEPSVHAAKGNYAGFGKTPAEIEAFARRYVLPRYETPSA